MSKQIPYKTSRDYKRLKELLDKGYQIVCFIDYRWPDKYVCRDICRARYSDSSKEYSFSARGNSYSCYWVDFHKFTFEELCERDNVEFIDIQEE